MSAPAGFYPDPASGPRRRWWSGSAWTEHLEQPAAPVAQAPYGGYPAYPASAPVAEAPRDVDTNTVWVWLAIVASVVPFLTVFLIDWNGYLDAFDAGMRTGETAQIGAWEAQTFGVSLLSWAAIAAFIVFCWLDWRELRRRAIPAPFHWAWSFFALLSAGVAVSMIGRTVVLRRRTVSGGWPPLWVWLGATVLGYIVMIVWVVGFVSEFFQRIALYA